MRPLTARRADGWIVGPPPARTPAVRLFCLPYVGGAASVYEPWRGAFGDDVEVCPVELPGHQTRLREPAFTHVDALVDALASALVDELDVPYALFGHSLGSLVAFELARELRRRGVGEPRALLVSGGPAPALPRVHPPVHGVPPLGYLLISASTSGSSTSAIDFSTSGTGTRATNSDTAHSTAAAVMTTYITW